MRDDFCAHGVREVVLREWILIQRRLVVVAVHESQLRSEPIPSAKRSLKLVTSCENVIVSEGRSPFILWLLKTVSINGPLERYRVAEIFAGRYQVVGSNGSGSPDLECRGGCGEFRNLDYDMDCKEVELASQYFNPVCT
jgi:hypothetical protein